MNFGRSQATVTTTTAAGGKRKKTGVTRRLYGKGCDVWGAGVMLHVLLSGRLPFLGSGVRLQQSIARGRLSVSGS